MLEHSHRYQRLCNKLQGSRKFSRLCQRFEGLGQQEHDFTASIDSHNNKFTDIYSWHWSYRVQYLQARKYTGLFVLLVPHTFQTSGFHHQCATSLEAATSQSGARRQGAQDEPSFDMRCEKKSKLFIKLAYNSHLNYSSTCFLT